MVRTLFLMLALVAAILPQATPAYATSTPGIEAAAGCHQTVPASRQHEQGTPLSDRHICIGCAIPTFATHWHDASRLPEAIPLARVGGLDLLRIPALDPPPPRLGA